MKLQQIISSFLVPLLTVPVYFALSACSPPAQETAPVAAPEEAVTPPSAEIPVSTATDSARALYEEGTYLMDVGRGVQAREKFLAAIAEDPGFALAYWGQSNVALSFAEFQQSLDAASEYAASATDAERKLIDINRSFLSNDSAKGVAMAMELVAAHPGSARAQLVLAGMLANQNDNEAARAANEAALALADNSAGALFALANNYLFGEPKDFTQAESWAQKIISAYPGEARGFELLGDIKRAQNDFGGALTAYKRASHVDPTLEAAAHKRGHVNSFLGNIDAARAAYDEAIAMAPVESKAGYAVYKAFTNIHGGDVAAALDELETLADQVEDMGTPADQVKGFQVFALTSAASAALHAGIMDRAAALVARRNALVIAIAEDVGTDDARRLQEANAHLWDGLLAAYAGNADGAIQHSNMISALVESDDNPRKMEPAHWLRGMNALQAGDYSAAVSELRNADHRNNMFIRYHLALAEAGDGNSDAAKKLFGEVARFNFNSVGFALVRIEAAARAE